MNIVSRENIALHRFLHNHGNIATEQGPRSELNSYYSYRMTPRVRYSAQYHRQHCALQAFEQSGSLYMHNLEDTHPTQSGFETSTSEF